MTADRGRAPDHPIDAAIAERWSPYVFSDREVSEEDLLSLFEAARWAPSSYNEQPWRYIVATKKKRSEFDKMLSCLVEKNREWAQHAPVLALGVVSLRFERNGKANRAAHHDLGLASAGLSYEATKRGLSVHQMTGILPDRARDLYGVPEAFEVFTGLAIGYRGEAGEGPEELAARDSRRRSRRPVSEFVFSETWERSLR
jgi:nitroreductase